MPAPTFESVGAEEAGTVSQSSVPSQQEGGFDHNAATGSGASNATKEDPVPTNGAPPTDETPAPPAPPAASEPAPVNADPEPVDSTPPAPPEEPAESPTVEPAASKPSTIVHEPSPFAQESSSFSQASSPWGEDPDTSGAPTNLLAAFVPAPVQPPPAFVTPQLVPLPAVPPQALELLQSIDQAMNACATNLATLQKLSGEQTDVLKTLTHTLQNQTLSQIGLNLNSLTDSLSAALEPMKAIGELVPAMDQLVTTLEGREADSVAEKLSPDQLVTSLADQLSAGLIDPWTFKCAYMAVYPTDHPADLLHRLVELLGTQRLSGDLFRAAYEAVQAAEPPAGGGSFSSQLNNIDPSQLDETIRKQLDSLQKSNEEMRKRQEDREAELQRILETKDKELSELHAKMEGKYEEVSESIGKREDEYRSLLESKDMELVEKESENNMLRAQMEELRSQTEDMVKDMQKQIAEMKVAHDESMANQPPKPVSSFFDNAPSPARSLFDSGPQRALFDQQQQQISLPSQPTVQQPMPVQQQAMPVPQQPIGQSTTQPMTAMAPPMPTAPQMGQMPVANGGGAPPTASPVVPPSAPQPPPAPPAPPTRPQQAPTTPFSQGQGSYGSGVRAQVFEVIVRQALAGAPWREICAGPMQVNNITPDEVESEVKRRQALLNK